ncbi:MAG: hypothetical protein JSR98_19640 [Proteobacteria bacterium]|nr:hypothetical protein [Pseudomonadota bacterium]
MHIKGPHAKLCQREEECTLLAGKTLQTLVLSSLGSGLLLTSAYTAAVRLNLVGYPEDGGPGSFVVITMASTLFSAAVLSLAYYFWRLFLRKTHPTIVSAFQVFYLAIAIAIPSLGWSFYFAHSHSSLFNGP